MVRPKVRNFQVFLAVLVLLTAQAFGRASGRSPEPAGLNFKVVPTVFYADVSGGLKQLLNVDVENAGPEVQGDLKINLGATEQTFHLGRLASGKGTYPIYLPDVKVPVAIKLTLKAGAATVEKNFILKPQRKWTVYLFHHSHTDIGYTELQSRVGANHLDYLDSVIDYCRATEDYPDDAKFRWNIEVSWALQYYRLMAPKARSGSSSTSSGRGASSSPGWSSSFPTVSPTRSSSARSILPMRWGASSISRSRRQ